MKKFTITALAAMGIFTIASAAFAGQSPIQRNNADTTLADTVLPEQPDTVVPQKQQPEKSDSTPQTPVPPAFALADTVVPEQPDTVVPKKQEPEKQEPQKQEPVKQGEEPQKQDPAILQLR